MRFLLAPSRVESVVAPSELSEAGSGRSCRSVRGWSRDSTGATGEMVRRGMLQLRWTGLGL